MIFTIALLACDIIIWINNLIDIKNLSTRLLLIPFILRLYILYELVELMIIVFNKHFIDNTEEYDSTATPSTSSTTTTLETNVSPTINSSLIHDHPPSQPHKTIKRRIFHYLILYYLIHSSLMVFVNFYFWSNNFQLSEKSTLHMNYIIPQWTTENDLLLSPSTNVVPSRPSLA